MKKTIAVIDLKAFYAYTECVDRGLDPWKTPLVVADKERGTNTIVLSVSPYLKSLGVPSRLRIKELPPRDDYIYATPRMERYIAKSQDVLEVFLDFFSEEDIHVYSIDESFIDLTSYIEYYKMTDFEIVKMVIGEIQKRTGLQATAGIGDNFFLAKVALDIYAKHEANGVAIMHKSDVHKKLWPITPLSKIWGIGSRMEIRLNRLGLYTVKDIACSSCAYLEKEFGIMGEQLWNHANGIDEADIHEVYVPESKSLSQGQVLFKDFDMIGALTIVREMCDDLALRLRRENKQATTVSLYIGYSGELGGFSQQMSLLSPTDNTFELFTALSEIYHRNIRNHPIRRVGIWFAGLKEKTYTQLDIFKDDKVQINEEQLQHAIDFIHLKYGKNSLLRLSALTEDSTAIERHNQIGGHRR